MSEDDVLQRHKYLSELYKKDPEEFEKVTNQMVETLIKETPPQYQLKLRVLQIKWDASMKKANTPHNRLTLAKNIFFEHFYNIFQPSLRSLEKIKDKISPPK